MPVIEKRLNQRIDLDQVLESVFSATSTVRNFPTKKVRGLDISSGGISVESDVVLLEGEVLKLLIPFGRGDVCIPVLAEVRWSEVQGKNYRMGLRFLA
jgi:hypothetical protein